MPRQLAYSRLLTKRDSWPPRQIDFLSRSSGLQEFPGDLEIWRFGDLEIWRFGDLEIWRFGDLEIWRFGDLVGVACFATRFKALQRFLSG